MALTQVSSKGIKDATLLNEDVNANANIAGSKLADNSISLAKLLHGDSNNNGKFLRANNGADPTFETVSTDLVADTSPQLGGNLDTNGFEIALDADKAVTFDGKGNIEYKSSQFQITNSTGDILIDNNSSGHDVQIYTDTNFEVYVDNGDDAIKAIKNGAVELYYNNSKKLETTSTGVTVTGNVFPSANDSHQLGGSSARWQELNISDVIDVSDNGKLRMGNSDDLQIYHDGSTNLILTEGPNIKIGTTGETFALFKNNNAVELYYDNSKKAETASGGFTVTGNISVSGTVDGRDVASDGSKLDGIASGANNITNNNQLSNGAGYMSGSSSQLCKAFVNYSGNNNSIRNDYNVSSITDHGTGDQTVNFSNSISMSYTVCGMPIAHDTGGTRCTNAIRGSSSSGPTRMNSTGVRINRGFGSHNAFADGHTMCVAIFRP